MYQQMQKEKASWDVNLVG